MDPDVCPLAFGLLMGSSRSFGPLISFMESPLRDNVCIMYLCLRALDTLEDDSATSPQKRADNIDAFMAHSMHDENAMLECSQVQYKPLMEAFGSVVVRALRSLTPEAANQVHTVVRDMGGDMARLLREAPVSISDWKQLDDYTFAVAGRIVAPMLSLRGVSPERRCYQLKYERLASSVQLTNIIRDVWEDLTEQGRCFWPATLWREHGETPQAALMGKGGVQCLNEMVHFALRCKIESHCEINAQDLPFPLPAYLVISMTSLVYLCNMYGNASVLNSRFAITRGSWEELTISAYAGDTKQCTLIGLEHLRRLRKRIDNPVHVVTVDEIITQLTSDLQDIRYTIVTES